MWALPAGVAAGLVALSIGAALATGGLALLPRLLVRVAVLGAGGAVAAFFAGRRFGVLQKLGARWARRA